jgi:phenylalanine-4-hydroxylase
MSKKSKYQSIMPNSDGLICYPAENHHVWSILLERQKKMVEHRACEEFIQGIELLAFEKDKIPQHRDITQRLRNITGWGVEPVAAVIPAHDFFTLLKNKKFPAASFIRTLEELDYLQEPDIFHELFGHCPLLTNQAYANFMHDYGKLALDVTAEQRRILFRLFWFTIEFGLIETKQGIRIFGGGILSSKNETVYSLEDQRAVRKPLDIISAMRTPFRIDIMQPLYYVLSSMDQLFGVLTDRSKVLDMVAHASELGDLPPLFASKKDSQRLDHNDVNC